MHVYMYLNLICILCCPVLEALHLIIINSTKYQKLPVLTNVKGYTVFSPGSLSQGAGPHTQAEQYAPIELLFFVCGYTPVAVASLLPHNPLLPRIT